VISRVDEKPGGTLGEILGRHSGLDRGASPDQDSAAFSRLRRVRLRDDRLERRVPDLEP
jgi:hypothetical protein